MRGGCIRRLALPYKLKLNFNTRTLYVQFKAISGLPVVVDSYPRMFLVAMFSPTVSHQELLEIVHSKEGKVS